MNNKNLALGGAGLLTVGLFLPVVTLPFLGAVNLFNNGTNWLALGLLALAVISVILALKERGGDVFFAGIGAAGALIYKFASLQYALGQMRANFAEAMKDNPFAGVAQAALGSVQLQWGWLVLAAGAGLLVYAGAKARNETGTPLTTVGDYIGRGVATIALLVILIGPALDLYGYLNRPKGDSAAAPGVGSVMPGIEPAASASSDSGKLAQEKASYIAQHITLYDLDARYRESLLDGRVPGVTFKLKNSGTRTLNEVKVRVVFQDEAGKNIAEEEYYPVLVSETNFSGDNKPLRPNYVWAGKRDEFYSAKGVPSEWKSGKATASVVEIEFGPDQ